MTKAIKDWEQRVRDHGCVVSRETNNIQIHHVFGRTYKHNKTLIGPWYILPLAYRYHDSRSGHWCNVTSNRKEFAVKKGFQRDMFHKMCIALEKSAPLPFGDDVLAAILDSPLR